MKVKRILAALISAAMVMPSVPIVSQAALVSGADKAQMNMVLLEPDDSQTIKFKEVTANDLSLTKDSEFYVGIKMVNFKNIEEAANYVAGSKGGLNDIAAGIAYNTEYVQFEPDCQYPDEGSYILSTDDVITNWNKRMDFADSILKKNKMPAKYKYLDAMIEEMDTTTTDSQKGYTKEVDIAVSSSTATSSTRAKYSGADDAYFAIVKFKFMKDATTAPAGTNIVGFSSNPQFTSMSFGISGDADKVTYQYEGAESGNIQSIFNVVDFRGVDILPAGAARKTGISVKSGTMASTQFVGDVFKPGVNLQFNYDDGSYKDLGESDTVTYKYGAAGITAADNAGLTPVPATLTTDVNGNHIYAIVGNFICDLGELTVSEIKTTEITVSGAPTTAYDGTAINFNDLVATIKKNNGTSVGDLKFTNYENVSNGLAIYKSNADGDVLAQVTASDTYTHGLNYFVVAVKSDTTVKSTVFTVTSNYDDITITKDTNAKTSYNKGDKFDPSAIAVKAKKASETGEGTKVSYNNFDGNYKVVIATNAEEAKTAPAVDANTDITETMLNGTHKVYVVYTNASGTKSVAEVGTLGAKKIKSATISGGKTAYTYGDKLKTDDLELNVTYDDDNSTGKISYADLAAAGITVKIGETLVDANTVITPAMKGKTVDFIYDGKTLTSSAKITVAAKTVYYTVSDATITKVYDGGLTIPADQTLPTISIKDSATAFVGTDSYTVTGTFAYTDKNVGTDKKIKLTTTLPETNGKYTFAPDTDKINADGTLKTAATITAKALTLNAGVITGLSTKADPNATADVTKDGSLVLTKDNSNLVDGDNVTVPYTYTFAKDDVKTAGTDKPVTITLKDLTGADKDNYTFDKTQVTTAKGNVTQDAMSDIEISGPTKVTYTYPELTPDFSGLVVNAVYGTGASATKAPVTNYKLLDKDGNEFDKTAKLPYGDTTITVSYTEGSVTKTKTITLTAKKKPIKLSDIIFKPESKSYDGTTTATGTATVKEGVTVAGDTVNISAKWEFDGKDVGTNTIKVSDIKADNENYEIVGEDNLPVSSTTINHSTAVIKPATPENVTAKADKKTNNIVLSGTTADFEYSTDNGATWVKAAAGTTTIENALRNKEYTILVRTAATTSAPASDAATVKATTYKYLVNIYKNGAAAGSEPEYKVYTNDEEINAVKDDTTFGKFNSNVLQYTPSRFSAYFTDSACTTSADVANLPKDSNDNINLYYTAKKSSGGGGGGGRSVSIKLDKDTVSGVVGDKIKVTATVTGSTAKPTWTSSNEDVTTVDENGNITLVGKGTATVKVKVNGIVKNIPVTVKEATATPVPTVKPTEAPVINTEYTKPYASGYDDGSFLPNNNITRGELAAMIARLSYGDDLPDGMYQASFPDVDSDAWFNKYIGYLEDKDVLSGYEDGTFRPMDTITRGEISAVIARAQRYDLISYNGIFTDVTENDWAKDYIETLADKNIVSGYEDGTFGPYSPLTRAEAVAIINRVLVESTPIVTFTPNDIAGHWAEADILLAVNERMVGANAVVPTVKPEETAAPEETVAPETTVTPEETVAPEKTTAPEATPAA